VTLEAFGNLGELVGGIGVVITLAYLAIQIRRNATASRSVAIQSVYSEFAAFGRLLGSNPQVAGVWRRGSADPNSLDEDELDQYISLTAAFMRTFENIHTQFQVSERDDAAWEPFDVTLLAALKTPGAQFYWRMRSNRFGAAFRGHVNLLVQERVIVEEKNPTN
jgi:hypothetical protein